MADLVRWPLIPNEKLLDIQEANIAPIQLITEAIRWRMAPARNKFRSGILDVGLFAFSPCSIPAGLTRLQGGVKRNKNNIYPLFFFGR